MRTGIVRRRRERERIIRRRRRIVARVWKIDEDVPDHLWVVQPGRLDKYNLKCDCGICKNKAQGKRFIKKDRLRYKQEVRVEVAQAM